MFAPFLLVIRKTTSVMEKNMLGIKGVSMYLYNCVQKVFCSINYIVSYTLGVQGRAYKSLCKVSDFIQNRNCRQIVVKLYSKNFMKIHFMVCKLDRMGVFSKCLTSMRMCLKVALLKMTSRVWVGLNWLRCLT